MEKGTVVGSLCFQHVLSARCRRCAVVRGDDGPGEGGAFPHGGESQARGWMYVAAVLVLLAWV